MPSPLELHFLDVGPIKYADCLVIRCGTRSILIDGGHKEDVRDRDGYPSIPTQLGEIFGGQQPYAFDLLVLTHCHNDHIGCLPELISQGVITCRKAFVADETLGWGHHQSDAIPEPRDPRIAGVLGALREENAASLSDAEIDQAIADSGQLLPRLVAMFDALEAAGTEVVRCDGTEDRAAIEAEFAAIDLHIVGPTAAHLRLCADQIAREQRDAAELLGAVAARDASVRPADMFRAVTAARFGEDGPLLADGYAEGWALNCQSIVTTIAYGGKKVLLAGDMQFAEPQVRGLDAEMAALRSSVQSGGPYDLVKTCHHSSHNGWDESIADEWLPSGARVHLVHSGGLNDPSHPASQVLREIRDLRRHRDNNLTWLRTDRNGRVSFAIGSDGVISYRKKKGRVNNFQPNADVALVAPVIAPHAVEAPLIQAHSIASSESNFVEVVTRIPMRKVRVTLTIEVDPAVGGAGEPKTPTTATPSEPATGRIADPPVVSFALPADRVLPPLLFVTDEQALARRIGAANARAAIVAVESAGQRIFSTERLAGRSAVEAAAAVRPLLSDGIDGVVILGGADVVPFLRLDVLGPDLRPQVEDPEDDPDNFIIWNDELYGDRDGDQLAEVPVSRIPDGASSALLASALGARDYGRQTRFGIRNVRRPFANVVFNALPGNEALLVSQPTRSTDLRPRDVQAGIAYFMLHGDDADTRRFWGETAGNMLEAFSVDQVPPQFTGIVFAGCCWGALTTTRRAVQFESGEAITSRTSRDSIPLRFLASGGQAFVGCTGVHYSPGGNAPTSAGGPMHTAFFARLVAGDAPARALFRAKQDCLQGLVPDVSPEELAVSLKIIRQFTCLGLGW